MVLTDAKKRKNNYLIKNYKTCAFFQNTWHFSINENFLETDLKGRTFSGLCAVRKPVVITNYLNTRKSKILM
jgi:hypothetical protein